MSYHKLTLLENISGATTATKLVPKPTPMTKKNCQSNSLLEEGAEGSDSLIGAGIGDLLEFVQLFIKGGPHNPSLPSNEVGENDWS